MLVSEAPIGTELVLGTTQNEEIVWLKVSDQSDFITKRAIGYYSFDANEYQSTSRARRNHGNNFFPQSNIYKWLNSDDSNWFEPTHEFDVSPNYHNACGFLSNLDGVEKSILMDREISVLTPLGSRKEFGRVSSLVCKVCLPAINEIYRNDDEALKAEGAYLPATEALIPGLNYSAAIMTRTGTQDAGHIYALGRYGLVSVFGASDNLCVYPMIRINPETEITSIEGSPSFCIAKGLVEQSDFLNLLEN